MRHTLLWDRRWKTVRNCFISHNHRWLFALNISKQSLALTRLQSSVSLVRLLLLNTWKKNRSSCGREHHSHGNAKQPSSITDSHPVQRRCSHVSLSRRTIFGLQKFSEMVRNYYLSRKRLTSPNVSALNHAVYRHWQQSLKLCLSPEVCIALELVEHFSEGTRSDLAEVSFIGMEHELKI